MQIMGLFILLLVHSDARIFAADLFEPPGLQCPANQIRGLPMFFSTALFRFGRARIKVYCRLMETLDSKDFTILTLYVPAT